jgi:ribosomal protein L37AE/L43A
MIVSSKRTQVLKNVSQTAKQIGGLAGRAGARKQRALDADVAELAAQRRVLRRLAACGSRTLLPRGRSASAAQSWR